MARKEQNVNEFDLASVVAASEMNGDDIKVWLEKINPQLRKEVEGIVVALTDLVSLFIGSSKGFQKAVSDSEPDKRQVAKVLIALRSFKYSHKLAPILRLSVTNLSKIYLQFAKDVFLASSTRLIEGLHQQFFEDEELHDTKLIFESTDSDKILDESLVLAGMPLSVALWTQLWQILSEHWFTLAVTKSFAAEPTLDRVTASIQAQVQTKGSAVEKVIMQMAFNIAHYAIRKATLQFADVAVEVH